MKKLLLMLTVAVATCLMSVQTASAQRAGLYWGPKASVNFTKFSTKAENFRTGYDIGVMVGGDFTLLGVETGLMFSNNKSSGITTNAITIPVTAKVFLLGGMYAFAGPCIEFLINDKYEVAGGNFDPESNLLNTVSVSGLMGVAYQFPMIGLSVGLSYKVGSYAVDNDFENAASNLDFSNKFGRNTFAINAGWRF